MAEYIEREAALAFPFANGRYDHEHANEHFIYGCENYKEWLAQLPAADVVAVVRGKWIPDYDYTEYDYDGSTPLPEPRKFQDGWQCSLCGGYMPSETNFCPNCGALMDKDGDGE